MSGESDIDPAKVQEVSFWWLALAMGHRSRSARKVLRQLVGRSQEKEYRLSWVIMGLMAHACHMTLREAENYDEIAKSLKSLWDKMLEDSVDPGRIARTEGIDPAVAMEQARGFRDGIISRTLRSLSEMFKEGGDPHSFGKAAYQLVHGEESRDAFRILELLTFLMLQYQGFTDQLIAVREGRL